MLVQHQAVRTRNPTQDAVKSAVGLQAVNPTAGILQARLALVGKIQVTRIRECDVIDALEALEARAISMRCEFTGFGVQQKNALLVIGDEHAAVLVQHQAVGLSVVFNSQLKFALWGDAKNAAVG